ncbi:CD276 antigen isoform X1 [Perca fluviatilis]|uniref:CD276 antigen isoform X1 n=1 Tax=Perca fluviatilis TaxID=8168 RepID=UPI001965D049|nr:CD276 antigen isoform X1 [Perca fluviatilis]XP_039651870.1 CD276 antigen isoform X1 [Perca fluviatilis]XP_039651879.1 CD276 antigen isoform X1 [Perca fluviatilis]XP_039651888.1 CD276 antigen isoform X1 [Perca fluviatilis]
MASMGILLFFTAIYIRTGNTNAGFVNVECQAEKVGQYGQQSLLQCVVKTTQDLADLEIRVVTWTKEDRPLLVFHEGKNKPQPGYSFADPSWNDRNMNVSLLITNTAVEHEGVYKCTVITDSGDGKDSTSLKVTAKYNKPTIHSNPETVPLNTDVTLMCNSDGGYPKGQLRWFDENNTEWTKSSQMEAKQTESGLFNLSSKLSLLKGSIFTKYTCKVFNASGDKEEEATFEVQHASTLETQKGVGSGSASKIVAPVVVIGSLIVGLLLALLIYRRRSQQARRHSTTPLMSDHRELPICDYDDGDHQERDKTCQVSPA